MLIFSSFLCAFESSHDCVKLTAQALTKRYWKASLQFGSFMWTRYFRALILILLPLVSEAPDVLPSEHDSQELGSSCHWSKLGQRELKISTLISQSKSSTWNDWLQRPTGTKYRTFCCLGSELKRRKAPKQTDVIFICFNFSVALRSSKGFG